MSATRTLGNVRLNIRLEGGSIEKFHFISIFGSGPVSRWVFEGQGKLLNRRGGKRFVVH